MCDEPKLKDPVRRAVNWIVKAQNPGQGWRYGIQPKENDSSVTAWMVMALMSAEAAGFEFDAKTVYKGANTWFDLMVGENEEGYDLTNYRIRGIGTPMIAGPGRSNRLEEARNYPKSPALDACNIMVRVATARHVAENAKKIEHFSSMIARTPPIWYHEDESKGPWQIDMVYWYFATMAMHQLGETHWEKWETKMMKPVLLKYQRGWHEKDIKKYGEDITTEAGKTHEGRFKLVEHGSWDPVGAWGTAGGRVYSTAMGALILQSSYRYKRLLE